MEELIEKAKKGDKEAFTQVILSVKASLYKIAKMRTSNDEDVQDIIQETMIDAYKYIKKLKGIWNIEIELPSEFYNRNAIIYSVKDESDKNNNVILEQAVGSYTEMHLQFTVKELIEPYETTKESMDRLLEDNILANPKNDIKAVLENENGKTIERVMLNREGNDGTTYHPSGDATVYMTIPITKEDYTDNMKLHLTIKEKQITINLSK